MTLTTGNMSLLQGQDSDNAESYLATFLATSLTAIDAHDHSSTKGVPVKRLANGTFASRPAAGNAGHVYLSTDANRVTWDNGSSWIEAVINATSQAVSLGGGLTVTAGGAGISGGLGLETATAPGAGVLQLPDTGRLNLGTTNPAGAGVVRLRNNTAVDWRNAASTNDHSLSFNSGDQFQITTNLLTTLLWDGTTPFLQLGSNLTPAGNGILRLPNNKGIDWRNAANTADDSINFDGNDRLAIGTVAGNVVLTVGVGGTASAMPAPQEYLVVTVNGNARRIALFN